MAGRTSRARRRGERRPDRPRVCLAPHLFSASAGRQDKTAAWRRLHSADKQHTLCFAPGKSTDQQSDWKHSVGLTRMDQWWRHLGASRPGIRQTTNLDRRFLCWQKIMGEARRQSLRGLRPPPVRRPARRVGPMRPITCISAIGAQSAPKVGQTTLLHTALRHWRRSRGGARLHSTWTMPSSGAKRPTSC